jgi:hypothetical protein
MVYSNLTLVVFISHYIGYSIDCLYFLSTVAIQRRVILARFIL